MLSTVADDQLGSNDLMFQGPANEDKNSICNICYGILQFIYVDEKQKTTRKDCANELAVSIHELARQEGYQVDGFSLEVSIPPFILEKENAIRWTYLCVLALLLLVSWVNSLSSYSELVLFEVTIISPVCEGVFGKRVLFD